MNIIIKDKQFKDKYDYLVKSTLNKVVSLLDVYGFLGNENVTLNTDHLDYQDISVEIVIDYRDYVDFSPFDDMDLSIFNALDKSHYRIILFSKILENIINSDEYIQIELARNLFKVFVYLSCFNETLQLSIDFKALNNISNIFECLFASFIGKKEHVLSVCENICHSVIRARNPIE